MKDYKNSKTYIRNCLQKYFQGAQIPDEKMIIAIETARDKASIRNWELAAHYFGGKTPHKETMSKYQISKSTYYLSIAQIAEDVKNFYRQIRKRVIQYKRSSSKI